MVTSAVTRSPAELTGAYWLTFQSTAEPGALRPPSQELAKSHAPVHTPASLRSLRKDARSLRFALDIRDHAGRCDSLSQPGARGTHAAVLYGTPGQRAIVVPATMSLSAGGDNASTPRATKSRRNSAARQICLVFLNDIGS